MIVEATNIPHAAAKWCVEKHPLIAKPLKQK